jgi:hypothetical protein
MAEASRAVLGGFELGGDATIVRWPDRYMDERGVAMWELVMRLLDEITSSWGTLDPVPEYPDESVQHPRQMCEPVQYLGFLSNKDDE